MSAGTVGGAIAVVAVFAIAGVKHWAGRWAARPPTLKEMEAEEREKERLFNEPLIEYAADVVEAFLSAPRVYADPLNGGDPKQRAVEEVIGRFPNGVARFNIGLRAAGTRAELVRRRNGSGDLTAEQRATFWHPGRPPMTDEEILNSMLAVFSAWVILSG